MEVKEKIRELENIDFSVVVKSIVILLELDYKRKNLTLNLHFEDDLPLIKAEKEDINKLVTNLISNAIKYNKENGTIDISIFLSDNYLKFEVKDTGIGLKDKDKQQVFQESPRRNRNPGRR